MGCSISRPIPQGKTYSIPEEYEDSVIIVVGYISDGSESGSHHGGSKHGHKSESLHSDIHSKNADRWDPKVQDEGKDSKLDVQSEKDPSPVYELDGGYDGGDGKEIRLQSRSDEESVKAQGSFPIYELDGDYWVAGRGNASGMDIKLLPSKYRPIKNQFIKPQIEINNPEIAKIQISHHIYEGETKQTSRDIKRHEVKVSNPSLEFHIEEKACQIYEMDGSYTMNF